VTEPLDVAVAFIVVGLLTSSSWLEFKAISTGWTAASSVGPTSDAKPAVCWRLVLNAFSSKSSSQLLPGATRVRTT